MLIDSHIKSSRNQVRIVILHGFLSLKIVMLIVRLMLMLMLMLMLLLMIIVRVRI